MLKIIYNLLTFRSSPEEIPFSLSALLVSSLALFLFLFSLIYFTNHLIMAAIWRTIIFLIVSALFVLISLQMKGFENRFVQTMTAIFTSEFFIFLLCMLPYVIMIHLLPNIQNTAIYVIGMMMSAVLVLTASVWLFMIISHIFEAALDISMLLSLLVSLILFGIQALVFSELYF